jgi:hypothetical protein
MSLLAVQGMGQGGFHVTNSSFNQKINISSEPNPFIYLETIPHIVFLVLYAFCTLVGILLNLIAILTYRFHDKKSVYQSTSNNFNNRILSIPRSNLNDEAPMRTKAKNQNGNSMRHNYGRMSSSESNNIRNLASINDSNQTSGSLSTNESNKYLYKFKSKSVTNQFGTLTVNHSHQQLHNSMLTLGTYNSGYNKIKRCSYFILMLSFCDLFICLLNMPIDFLLQSGYLDSTFKIMFLNSAHSDFLCKATYFLGKMPVVLEIELLLMIAIDRYAR